MIKGKGATMVSGIRSGPRSIQSMVRRRRLPMFGHVARMPDNVPTKAVLRVACDVRDRRSSTLPKLAPTVRSSSHYLAAPDLFRLWPVSWRCPQLCPGSGRVENVRYGLLGLVLRTTTMPHTTGVQVKCSSPYYRH